MTALLALVVCLVPLLVMYVHGRRTHRNLLPGADTTPAPLTMGGPVKTVLLLTGLAAVWFLVGLLTAMVFGTAAKLEPDDDYPGKPYTFPRSTP